MPSPSLFLGSSATLVSAFLLFSSLASASSSTYYALDTEYSGNTFFDGFNFYDDADPTHGFVTYVDEQTATDDHLITFRGNSVQMRVDSTHKYDGTAPYSGINGVGRPSVRIESIDSWTHGLFLADIKHMPTTTDTSGCGVWPAFWTLGSGDWPYNGEIDIIEGANNQATDLTSTHVAGTCVVSQSPSNMTGTSNGNNCQYDVNTGANAQGCGAFSKSSVSYGAGFNANKGGVYAMEWKSDAIKVWFFPRGSIPSDISYGNPDPSGWPLPDSSFDGPGCDIDANFADNRIIFDTTFCGDFGDATWSSGGCAALEQQNACSVFVGGNPSQFTEAYWDVNYVKVYQPKPIVSTTTSSTTSTTTTVSTSTTTTTTTTTTTSSWSYTHSFGSPHPTSTSTTPSTSSATTLSTTPYVHPTTSSPAGSPVTTPSSSSSTTWGRWLNTTSSSSSTSESSASVTWGDWTTTTEAPVDPTSTSSFDWADWESSKSSTSTKPVDPATTTSATTSSFDWADWEASTTKSTDPKTTSSSTSSFDWADWEASQTKSSDPKTTSSSTSSFDWADWEKSTSKSAAPTSTASSSTTTSAVTWGDWSSTTSSGSPVKPASTGVSTWVSPSVTIATTVTVAPVSSSSAAWVAATSANKVSPATFTGAAGRMEMNAAAFFGAGVVAVGMLAL